MEAKKEKGGGGRPEERAMIRIPLGPAGSGEDRESGRGRCAYLWTLAPRRREGKSRPVAG